MNYGYGLSIVEKTRSGGVQWGETRREINLLIRINLDARAGPYRP